jgi:starch synthase
MIAMKYGTLPIASDTGGLKDSILNGKNGFLFKKGKSLRLKKAIKHALSRISDKDRYRRMVECAMKTDFSWDRSAVLYKKLYQEMLSQNSPVPSGGNVKIQNQNSNLKSDKL